MPYFNSDSGHRIYYERYGEAGPPVILIHGLASSIRIWRGQIRELQKYCRVYGFDFPGHGRSDWRTNYSMGEVVEALRQLMDECGIERASLVALSLGCSVALVFAARYPERVDKVVLEGPFGGYHPWWNPLSWLDQMFFTLLPLAFNLSISLFGVRVVGYWLNTFGVKTKRNLKMLESVQQKTDLKAIRKLLWESACAPYAGHLERVTAPVLLVRGARDPMPERFVQYIRNHLKQVTYVEVSEARHLVAVEKPQEFNALLMQFLDLGGVRPRSGLKIGAGSFTSQLTQTNAANAAPERGLTDAREGNHPHPDPPPSRA